MYVLHACALPDAQYGIDIGMWAEDSALPVSSPSAAVRQVRDHPFAVPTDSLADILGRSEGARRTPQTLLLPSLQRSPLDPPEMVRIQPRRRSSSAPSLLPWSVPVMRIPASELSSVLDSILGDQSEVDVRPAASVHYVAELRRHGEMLVDRSRVLPTCVIVGRDDEDDNDTTTTEVQARWRVFATGADAVTNHGLVQTMPPSFRAAAPETPQAELTLGLLDGVVDALVRRRLPANLLAPRRGRRPSTLPAAETWFESLTGDDARVDIAPAAAEELIRELDPWVREGAESPGPAQLVLRLRDPEPEGGALTESDAAEVRWHLDFLLRSRSDQSLVIDAFRVWDDDGSLARWLDKPREVLLAELARAQRVYPDLEAGLRRAEPTELELSTSAAFDFLNTAATGLAEAGVEVQLPSWWGTTPKVGLKLHATPTDGDPQEAKIGRDGLASFDWALAVGDHGLSDDEIAALIFAKAPLVQMRGQWIVVDQERIRRGLDFLKNHEEGQMPISEVMTLALGDPEELETPLEITSVEADGWLGDLLDGTAAQTIETVDPPEDFRATLRPYQARGLSWLDFLGRLGIGAVLADDMGLGKTVQLLALEATARARAYAAADPDTMTSAPTLLLCPMSLIGNWEAEAARFAPSLRILVYYGPARPRGDELDAALAEADLVITTYATASRDIAELERIGWERVVLDEAQVIKNRLSQTTKAIRRLNGRQKIALTGTPVENRLSELWSIMDFVNPGMLGTPEKFRERFARPIEVRADEEQAHRLRRITRPYILRRTKTDPRIIDDLPEKIEIKQHYRLTVEQASLYQSVVAEMMGRIEESSGIERRGLVLAAMTKLKQVCNHPAHLLHDGSAIGQRSGKLERFEEIMSETLAEGDRVLCFTQFTDFGEMLVPHLASKFDTDVAYLAGSTSKQRRTQIVKDFQEPDGPRIFVLSLKAGGTGLNLTAANQVVHLDRWWNPAVENQATDRAFRIGQKRRVQVRKFIGIGTLEERIDAILEEKKELADMVVGEGESWLTEMSTDSLRDLLTLSKDAVGE